MAALRGLYAITPDNLSDEQLQSRLEQVLAGGAQLVQYRNKRLSAPAKRAQAERLQALCRRHGKPFLVNDDLALAEALGADGIHLGQTDGSVSAARSALGPSALIGVTCQDDPERAAEAQSRGADYVAFGRFFPSATKPQAPPAPLAVLEDAKARLDIPVVAIGGITPANAAQALARGADMVAVIHGIFASAEAREHARAIAALFQ